MLIRVFLFVVEASIILVCARAREVRLSAQMGGGTDHGHIHGDFRTRVWSMPGGPYCRPKHWKRNTAIAMVGVFLVCIPVAMVSAKLEVPVSRPPLVIYYFVCLAEFFLGGLMQLALSILIYCFFLRISPEMCLSMAFKDYQRNMIFSREYWKAYDSYSDKLIQVGDICSVLIIYLLYCEEKHQSNLRDMRVILGLNLPFLHKWLQAIVGCATLAELC